MNPLDARESEETYEYPARPYTLPMRPAQRFKVLSETGDKPATSWTPEAEDTLNKDWDNYLTSRWLDEVYDDAWSDKYLTAEDARVLRQDGI